MIFSTGWWSFLGREMDGTTWRAGELPQILYWRYSPLIPKIGSWCFSSSRSATEIQVPIFHLIHNGGTAQKKLHHRVHLLPYQFMELFLLNFAIALTREVQVAKVDRFHAPQTNTSWRVSPQHLLILRSSHVDLKPALPKIAQHPPIFWTADASISGSRQS